LKKAKPRQAIMQSYAVRAGHEYRYEVMQAVSSGPSFPNPQKAALLCVTTNGLLRLLWPQNDGKWYETTAEIESVISSEDLITHASICADKSKSTAEQLDYHRG
jgi:mediator of RNA polymerase II transcription subunit 16